MSWMNIPNSLVLVTFSNHMGRWYRELEEWGQEMTHPFFVLFVHCNQPYQRWGHRAKVNTLTGYMAGMYRSWLHSRTKEETELHCPVCPQFLLLQSGLCKGYLQGLALGPQSVLHHTSHQIPQTRRDVYFCILETLLTAWATAGHTKDKVLPRQRM